MKKTNGANRDEKAKSIRGRVQDSRLEKLALEALDGGDIREFSQSDFDQMREMVTREIDRRRPQTSGC